METTFKTFEDWKNHNSKYQLSWVFFIAKEGKATKRDWRILDKVSYVSMANGVIFTHCLNRSYAEGLVLKMSSAKLNKEYNAIIITDAQFGKMKGISAEEVLKVATKKQTENIFTIK